MFEYLVSEPEVQSGKPAPLLLMFHGYGSSKEDLFGLSTHLDTRFRVISIQGPDRIDESGLTIGFSWFPIYMTEQGIGYDQKTAEQIIPRVHDFILAMAKEYNAQDVFLLGFSQGAMVCHAVLLAYPKLLRGVAALSGRASHLFDKTYRLDYLKDFPLFVSHGVHDDIIPIDSGRQIRDFYQKTPVNLDYQEYSMGHEINMDCLKDLQRWAKDRLDVF
ncbi:MAG TPA: hypothetical protein ENI73_08545 [Spirochaetes bacterium]|nr:hypothetical protein [Spirochaetota bacterium]